MTEKWHHFLHAFTRVIDTHAPYRVRRLRNPTAPVVTDATCDLMQRRRQALAQLGHHSASYSELNRAVRSALRRDTRDDIQRRIAEGGASSVWRSIRNVVGDRRSGRVTPDATPDALNAYFVRGWALVWLPRSPIWEPRQIFRVA